MNNIFSKKNEKKPLDIEPGGNLKIALANGNVMNIPLSAVNISEEVNKTAIWKQVNDNVIQNKERKKNSKNSSRFKKKKSVKKEEKREENKKLEKRLSTMEEEEEDEGITIKSELLGDKEYWKGKRKISLRSDETHV